jgi:DNA-binding PadR family transcriptional regulator
MHRHGCEKRWEMAGRHGGPAGGPGGKHGGGPFGRHRGGPFGGGGRRLFDAGALRLVVLGLIAEEPRHGYDIIKALEARFQGAYSPSPGAIYPMLQMLEEADLVVSTAEGNKRLYAITDQGKAYLAENAAELEKINRQIDDASTEVSGVALAEEMHALHHALKRRMREGDLTAAQAEKALSLLKRTREELEGL